MVCVLFHPGFAEEKLLPFSRHRHMPSYKCYDWDIVRTGSAASAAARDSGGVDGWNRQTVNRGGLYRCVGSGGAGSDGGDGPVPDPHDPEFRLRWPAALPLGFVALSDP